MIWHNNFFLMAGKEESSLLLRGAAVPAHDMIAPYEKITACSQMHLPVLKHSSKPLAQIAFKSDLCEQNDKLTSKLKSELITNTQEGLKKEIHQQNQSCINIMAQS